VAERYFFCFSLHIFAFGENVERKSVASTLPQAKKVVLYTIIKGSIPSQILREPFCRAVASEPPLDAGVSAVKQNTAITRRA